MTLASLATVAMVAHAEDEPKVKIAGSLDLYYQYDFNRPATGTPLIFRNFDTKNNSFTFSAAQIKFSVAPGEGPVGGTLELLFGPNSDAFLSDDSGSERHIAQAFVSYVKDGLTVDFGKFYTWIGAETANAGDNANYSRGLLFTLAEPLYHVGVRASKQVSGITVTGAVVNGWNETENSNGQASVGLGLAWAGGPASFAANFYGGVEGGGSSSLASRGFGDGDGYKVSLLNLIGGYQVSESLKAGLAVDLGEADPTTSANKVKWSGIAAYLSYKLSEQNSGCPPRGELRRRRWLRHGKQQVAEVLHAHAVLCAEQGCDVPCRTSPGFVEPQLVLWQELHAEGRSNHAHLREHLQVLKRLEERKSPRSTSGGFFY